MMKLLFSCSLALLLVACSKVDKGVADTAQEGGALLVLDGVSVINTQKTLDDHLVSWISGRDCSTIRASKGEHYCVDTPAPVPTVVRTSYCYKSLASVDCYDRPLVSDAGRFFGTKVDNVPIGQ